MSSRKKKAGTSKKSAGTGHLTKVDAITVAADGSLRVDARQLAPPIRTYDADFAWPQVRLGAVSLLFGKSDLNVDNRLRTRLELRYPPEAFVGHFWENSRQFHAGLRNARENLPGWEDRDAIEPQSWEAEVDHSEWVNFDYIARTGSQAVLDFFHLSPQAVVRFKRGQGTSQLILEPVVRINMTTREILKLFDSCEVIAQQFEPLKDTIGTEMVKN